MSTVNGPAIEGYCDARYAEVRRAFADNFRLRGDTGAAVCVVRDGECLVDLWGGRRDEGGRPWQRDTVVNLWSTTKGIVATCFAMLAQRGLLTYEQPVAHLWPEFASAGKDHVDIAMLLSHQAGVCGFRAPAVLEDFFDQATAAARLAAQAPFWEPGTRFGYHALTIGVLANELFRRIDGRSLGAFVREELEMRFSLQLSVGLPAAWAERVAPILAPRELASATLDMGMNEAQVATLTNPVLHPDDANSDVWRVAELPSANGFGDARSLARLYGALANGGVLDGHVLAAGDNLAAATAERIAGVDLVMGIPARWAAGFLLNTDGLYGPNPRAFGHSGWGGSFAFADPDRRLAVAYVMNRMGTDLVGDPRDTALINAVYDAR